MEVEKERKEKEEDKPRKEKIRQITEWIKKRLKKKNIRKRKGKKLDLVINDIILYNSLSMKTDIGFIINKDIYEFEMRNEH